MTITRQIPLEEFGKVVGEIFPAAPNIESGEAQYDECLGHHEIWNNLSTIRTEDVQKVVVLFLNRWRCRLPELCVAELGSVLRQSEQLISPLRRIDIEDMEVLRTSESFDTKLRMLPLIENLFETIQKVRAGPKTVGFTATSKILHLTAPSFFMMSDQKIREHYGCEANGAGYANFMFRMSLLAGDLIAQAQGDKQSILKYSKWEGRTLARLLDNYNYTKFTLGM
jgi:hypothetical protein